MQQAPPQNNIQQQQQPHTFPHWLKVSLLCIQVLLLVFSVTLVSTFQLVLLQKKGALETHRKEKRRYDTKRTSVTNAKNFISTIAPSDTTTAVQLWKTSRESSPTNVYTTSAQAYWNQVEPYLKEWNALLPDSNDASKSHYLPAPSSHTLHALQKAAQLGHAEAQYFMANALASGILPFDVKQNNISVAVDILPSENSPETMQSYLYWHFAAMDGHAPAAMALAYRHQDETCQASLPYYEAASHAIMDYLEQSPNSRAMVSPPMDQHVLSEIFTKGAASQLSWQNQPYEPADALRYYHMRALQNDIGAAHTLAQLHHYGLRGVEQNTTLALQYYEMAAALDHKESAGQAGKFYFWGIGLKDWQERNYVKAQSYFQTGAPFGLDGCRQRFRNSQLLKQRKIAEADVEGATELCDAPSVNGLGLLQLFGMPLLLKRDTDKARKYFELARDMGNADASYNLAMMRLGWKTHFDTMDSLEGSAGDGNDPQTPKPNQVPNFLKDYRMHQHQASKADYLVALQDLATAANKGHVQAKHRLAMIYSHGVTDPKTGTMIVAKDCGKALKQFSWIANNASPHLSHHTRSAYKYYMSGNWQASLRHYLLAAEMGHEGSQVNAAFLLEHGECLSLEPQDCAAASLRLWKAAVQSDPEAALRVGDMYYYGRLRNDSSSLVHPGPVGWLLPLILYPERYIMPVLNPIVEQVTGLVTDGGREEKTVKEDIIVEKEGSGDSKDAETCEEGPDGTCLATASPSDADGQSDKVDSDLEMAARYYQLAADVHKSPRANFNLGFLYEWGLGVKQDFPLAKRHYDLAKASPSGEADIAVKISLFAMNLHERIVKFLVAYQEWSEANAKTSGTSLSDAEQIPMAQDTGSVAGHPVPPGPMAQDGPKTVSDVIIKHLMTWESLVIVILTILLWKMISDRPTPRRNR